jgi:Capsule assembly protein Wzi
VYVKGSIYKCPSHHTDEGCNNETDHAFPIHHASIHARLGNDERPSVDVSIRNPGLDNSEAYRICSCPQCARLEQLHKYFLRFAQSEPKSPLTAHLVADIPRSQEFSRNDPGARFSSFDFTYRLPFVRNWLTLYTDSFAHDDVNPISAPRRAAIRSGIYLSHVPAIPHLDLRVEAASTDPPTSESVNGTFLEWETVQRQGTTNKGFLFGDALGREDKGGQAWITYHLSANEQIQFSYRNVKAAKDFIVTADMSSTTVLQVLERGVSGILLKQALLRS